MPPEYLTTKELAELLRIKERKVYDLAASGDVPCSKAMGKLLFPRSAINAWLSENTSGFAPQIPIERPNVFLGSHDPLLEWALREARANIATIFDGSFDGITKFEQNEGIATGLHIYDPRTDTWNSSHIAEHFKGADVVLIEWALRQRGLLLSPGAAGQIKSIADLKGYRARWCDRILLLDDGKLVMNGPPDTVLTEDNLAQVYGIRAHISATKDGLVIAAAGLSNDLNTSG